MSKLIVDRVEIMGALSRASVISPEEIAFFPVDGARKTKICAWGNDVTVVIPIDAECTDFVESFSVPYRVLSALVNNSHKSQTVSISVGKQAVMRSGQNRVSSATKSGILIPKIFPMPKGVRVSSDAFKSIITVAEFSDPESSSPASKALMLECDETFVKALGFSSFMMGYAWAHTKDTFEGEVYLMASMVGYFSAMAITSTVTLAYGAGKAFLMADDGSYMYASVVNISSYPKEQLYKLMYSTPETKFFVEPYEFKKAVIGAASSGATKIFVHIIGDMMYLSGDGELGSTMFSASVRDATRDITFAFSPRAVKKIILTMERASDSLGSVEVLVEEGQSTLIHFRSDASMLRAVLAGMTMEGYIEPEEIGG